MWMGNETAENGAVREQNAAADGQRDRRSFIRSGGAGIKADAARQLERRGENKKDRGIAAAALLNHELIQP